MLKRLASKLETLLDTLNAIAADELKRRHGRPDVYGPKGTEIRFQPPYPIRSTGGGGTPGKVMQSW